MIQKQKKTSITTTCSLFMEIFIAGLLILTHIHTFRIQIHLWLSQIRVMKEMEPITFSWEEIAIPGDTL